MKAVSLTALKKKAWKLLSFYVRTKDVDKRGRAQCFTCGIKKPWKKMHAGHFVQGRRPSILFELDIIRVQCVGCNRFRHGNLNVFTPLMIQHIGLDKVYDYWDLAETSVDRKPEDYVKLIAKFEKMIKEECDGIE